MEKIIKKDGYVYLVKGENNHLTFYKMGKDPDDPRWKEEEEVEKPKKRKKTKKEDEN